MGLVIDMQSRLYPFIHEHKKLTRNASILIKGLKEIGVPLMVTQQYTKGLGDTVDEIRDALGAYEVIEKMSFSCCDEPEFNEDLAVSSKRYVIITGIETHVCVLQTVIDLIHQAYVPVVVEDCVASRSMNDKNVAMERMRKEGAVITTYESLLFELLRTSGTDTFRAISKLVK